MSDKQTYLRSRHNPCSVSSSPGGTLRDLRWRPRGALAVANSGTYLCQLLQVHVAAAREISYKGIDIAVPGSVGEVAFADYDATVKPLASLPLPAATHEACAPATPARAPIAPFSRAC